MYISDIRPHQIQNVVSLNLAVGVSQNHHAVDLRKRWEKTNKNFTSYKMIIRFVFYFPVRLLLFRRRFFFLSPGSVAAKGLFHWPQQHKLGPFI